MSSLPKLLCIVVAFLFTLSPVFGQKTSLDDIIEAHVKALGGKEAVSKVDNVKRKAKVSLEGGFGSMNGTAEEIVDLKGKRYFSNLDLGQYKKIQAMTGDTGWFKGTDGDGEMNAQDIGFAKMNLGVSPLLSAYGTTKKFMKLKGTEKFGDTQCHVIAVGPNVEYLVDTKSSLLQGMKISDVGTISMSNYKEVEGVQFPAKRAFNIEAQGMTIEYEFTSIKINVEIDKSLFGDNAGSEESGSEGSTEPQYTAEQVITFLDKDGDKKISKKEAEASPELSPNFAYVDTSKDGFIDLAEAKAMIEYTKNQQSSQSSGDKMTARQLIATMDKNKDGKIGKDEADEELKPFFAEVDTNGDGFVDEKESQTIADFLNKR